MQYAITQMEWVFPGCLFAHSQYLPQLVVITFKYVIKEVYDPLLVLIVNNNK